MKKAFLMGTILALLIASTFYQGINIVQEAMSTMPKPIQHYIDETGNYFELHNSEYLNVTISSTSTVHMILCAIPKMIDFFIESSDGSMSTVLTLGNLDPSTIYYMYEDSYMNETVFTSNAEGDYTYTQDLSQLHHIFIQLNHGTMFIYENTTLTQDVYGAVEICADNIVLDLNGHSIFGGGYGVYCPSRSGVTVKNGTITAWYGFYEWGGSNNLLERSTICNGFFGILSWGPQNSIIRYNNISNSYSHGIGIWGTKNIQIYGNNISKNYNCGIFMVFSQNNKIFHNNFIDNKPLQAASGTVSACVWDDDYPSGGNYWNDYTGVDAYGGPYQNIAGSDGIGDTPYIIWLYENERDKYPLMKPWTMAASKEMLEVTKGGQSYPVQLCSTATITDVAVTSNNLHFELSGAQGTSAYVTAVLPVGLNTTNLKVFINNRKLTPPPYPVITSNGTHYFIYFSVTFASTSDIVIFFAPIPATVDQKPDALNLAAAGNYVTMYIELPEGYNINDINISTILLNRTIAIDNEAPLEISDYNLNGIPDLMVKFDRAEVIWYIKNNINMTKLQEKLCTVTFTINGYLNDETPFEGNDTIMITLHIGAGRNAIYPS